MRFDFTLSAALADTISALQVSLVTRGSSLDCTVVPKDCLVNQVTADRFVRVQDAAGKEHLALTFPLNLKSGSPSSQDVTVRAIPLGKDYAVVIEALSKDVPAPKLAGSSCTFVQEITPGTNPTLIAATIIPPVVATPCDPRVEK